MRKITVIIIAILMLISSLTGCAKDTPSDRLPNEIGGRVGEDGVYISKHLLSNNNADGVTRRLYDYLCETYKSAILSGQQESAWMGTPDYEMDYISEKTGKLPAIRGLDYINEDFDGVTGRAIDWWENGGIVSICWHWGTPPDGVGYDSSQGKIDLKEALTTGTELYNGMIAQMDRVAAELLKLQDAGVPVLWRPFHEFDGAWFWWGRDGADNFKALWELMYDRYTNYHGLNNLIWVLGYSHRVRSGWSPKAGTYDIGGADCYDKGSQISRYNRVKSYLGETIPLAYHECGYIPNPDALIADGAAWLWFLTWHTTYITESNTPEALNYIYNHDYVITLDELPDFATYTVYNS